MNEEIDPAVFTELLTSARREASARLIARGEAIRSVQEARDDPAGADDEHDPEGATLSDEWSRLEGLRRAAGTEIDEIDDALRRLEDGAFGVCASCGRDIPVGRLLVRPTATLCVSCGERGR
ncbi:TraR/DksA C4-type zinc finger protein [Microbacterium sp. SORGH_AS_0862]|uniref:TraR/DksA family transcriptional regulator n=1 Tax=Microbacterium sp. SORGH_AS_0862 TaxID=3041789 RepID=UPI00279074B2|nr:TraR/DksA C4-type zinc finger protein [Microbacterium sp. SORGH_AS_0862]MDQ1203750.1 DnaK suppressor protein [Microbacterium sp. SORGH_AS_0862]